MRAVLAVATAILMLVTAVAPHVHDGALGRHACVACVAAAGEQACSETPDVAPRAVHLEAVFAPPRDLPRDAYPLGAIPGQSPPRG